MAAPRKAAQEHGSELLGDRAVSMSLRARKLSLPALHNRETTAFLRLVAEAGPDASALIDHVRDMRPEMVFALVQSAARRLGEKWTGDDIGFADLSIQVARLQRILHLVRQRLPRLTKGPAFAIVVQPFDDHILGAALLEARLRHAGFATELYSAWNGEPLDRFDGVFLCVTNTDRREELEYQIAALRQAAGPDIPIMVGGHGARPGEAIAGADLVTSSLVDAVRFAADRAEVRSA